MTELPHGRKLSGRGIPEMVEPCPKKTGFMRQNFFTAVREDPCFL